MMGSPRLRILMCIDAHKRIPDDLKSHIDTRLVTRCRTSLYAQYEPVANGAQNRRQPILPSLVFTSFLVPIVTSVHTMYKPCATEIHFRVIVVRCALKAALQTTKPRVHG